MKKLVLLGFALICAVSLQAQGTVTLLNRVPGELDARDYGPEVGNSNLRKQGNTASGVPAGTTTYTGALLAGTGWTVELWGGPAGSSEAVLTPAVNGRTTFRTGTGAGIWTDTGTAAVITGAAGGTVATLQARVWDNKGGTVTTWAQALSDPTVAYGSSALFQSQPLGNPAGSPPTTPPNLIGLTSFNVAIVPEPGTIALGALGLVGLCLARRRK